MPVIDFIAEALVIRSARDHKRAAELAADLYNKGRESMREERTAMANESADVELATDVIKVLRAEVERLTDERDEAIDVIRELLGHRMVLDSDEEHLSAVNSRERARAYLRGFDVRKGAPGSKIANHRNVKTS